MKNKLIIIILMSVVVPNIYGFISYGECIDGLLNIRTSPSVKGNIVGQLETGEKFEYLERVGIKQQVGDYNDFWYKIRTKDNIEGYVFGVFIKNKDIDWKKYVNGYGLMKILPFDKKLYVKNTEVFYENEDISISKTFNEEFYIIKQDENIPEMYMVINQGYEYGWVNIDNVDFDDVNYYEEVSDIKNIDDINNSYIEAKFLEYLLKIDNPNIIRNGPKLEYKDYKWYDPYSRLAGYNIVFILNENQIILHKQYYEGRQYVIFNLLSGKETDIGYSKPYFNENRSIFYMIGRFYLGEVYLIVFKEKNEIYQNIFNEEIGDEYNFINPDNNLLDHYWVDLNSFIVTIGGEEYNYNF